MVQNESLATLLARLEGILGPIPDWMLQDGCFTHRYFTNSGVLYDQSEKTVSLFAFRLSLHTKTLSSPTQSIILGKESISNGTACPPVDLEQTPA